MLTLTLLFGAIVGLSLGLTGGGGALFAVPLLIFGLAVEPVQAVLISLVAVGGTALAGFIQRVRSGDVDLFAGAVFTVGGVLGAPAGTLIAGRLPEALLLTLFAALLFIVAIRMWVVSRARNDQAERQDAQPPRGERQFRMKVEGTLVLAGIATGLLSGLFGVGGGFIVVPALLFTTHMGIRQAVATSLMVIALTSGAAIGSFMLNGQRIAWEIAVPFMMGGIGGMSLGTLLSGALSQRKLQRIFAAGLTGVAVVTLISAIGH